MTGDKESEYPRPAVPDTIEGGASEAQEYFDAVLKELVRREARMAAVDEEISELVFRLEQLGDSRILAKGDPVKISSAAGYKRHLRRELQRKQQRRSEVLEEVERARERMRIAEDELAAEADERQQEPA